MFPLPLLRGAFAACLLAPACALVALAQDPSSKAPAVERHDTSTKTLFAGTSYALPPANWVSAIPAGPPTARLRMKTRTRTWTKAAGSQSSTTV